MNRTEQIEAIIEGYKVIRQHLRLAVDDISNWSLSHSQWLALSVVARGEQVTVRDVRLALGISSSAATQLVNGLVAKKHVTRSPHSTDGRVSVLVLSAPTKKAFARIRKQKLAEFSVMFRALNDDELAQYFALHTKLIQSIS